MKVKLSSGPTEVTEQDSELMDSSFNVSDNLSAFVNDVSFDGESLSVSDIYNKLVAESEIIESSVNSINPIGSEIPAHTVEIAVNSSSNKTLQGVVSVDKIQRSLRNVKKPDYNEKIGNHIDLSDEEGDPSFSASVGSDDGESDDDAENPYIPRKKTYLMIMYLLINRLLNEVVMGIQKVKKLKKG